MTTKREIQQRNWGDVDKKKISVGYEAMWSAGIDKGLTKKEMALTASSLVAGVLLSIKDQEERYKALEVMIQHLRDTVTLNLDELH